MGETREIIRTEFDDMEEIDTEKKEKHKPNNFKRKRKKLQKKGKKVQIWVKKETLEYEKNLQFYK